LRELIQKVGGIWSRIIFRGILFEGADAEIRGIWSHIIFRRILFEGADADRQTDRGLPKSWRDLEPYNFPPDSSWFLVCHTWRNLSVVPPAHAQRVYIVIFGLPPQSHKFPVTFFLRFVGGLAPQFFCHNFDTFTKITFFHPAASPPSQFHLSCHVLSTASVIRGCPLSYASQRR